MIKIKNLYKSYGEKIVFQDLSLNIEEGKITCIIGNSGIGKTSLLEIMMGLKKSNKGYITGIPECKSALFQEDRLIDHLSPIENIQIAMKEPVQREKIITNLKKVGLYEKFDSPVAEFSGGMMRRVALVRAMMKESFIVFLDEPFKGIDSYNSALMIDYIRSFANGKRTIISIIHDQKQASKLGHVIIDLNKLLNK